MMNNRKTKLLVLVLSALFANTNVSRACEVCKSKQPEILEGITHGPGPESNLDYIIIWTAVVIVSITLAASMKIMIRPGEKEPSHIKNIVVNKNG